MQHYQDQDMIIIGTPEECLEKIIRYDEVGVDQLLCYVQFGDLPHEKVMRNLELLATRGHPEARSARPPRQHTLTAATPKQLPTTLESRHDPQ